MTVDDWEDECLKTGFASFAFSYPNDCADIESEIFENFSGHLHLAAAAVN